MAGFLQQLVELLLWILLPLYRLLQLLRLDVLIDRFLEWVEEGSRNEGYVADVKRMRVIASVQAWQDSFEAPGTEKRVTVAFFAAVGDGPSHTVSPWVANLSEQYPEVQFLKVYADDLQDLAKAVGIQWLPTFVFFRGKAKVNKVEGAKTEEVEKALDKLLPAGPSNSKEKAP